MIHPAARGQEAKIVDYVMDTKKTLRDARQEREQIWMDCLEAYLGKFNDEWNRAAEEDHRSARYLNLTWDGVENIVAQLMAMLFPNEDWFRALPGRRGGITMHDDEAADDVQVLLRYQHDEMRFKAEFRKLLKWLAITGNCPWSLSWTKTNALDYPAYVQAMQEWMAAQTAAANRHQQELAEYGEMVRMAEMVGEELPPRPEMAWIDRPPAPEALSYEGPKLTVGDPFNFLIDDRANDPRSAFRVSTSWRTKAYLEAMAQRDESGWATYENLGGLRDAGQVGDDDRGRNRLVASAFSMQLPDKNAVQLDQALGDFEMFVGDVADDRTFMRNWICVVGNENTLLRFEQSHMWTGEPHVQMATLIPVPGQIYGEGLVEPVLDQQDAINARHNQIIDAVAVSINPETKFINDGVFDPEDAQSGAGGLIPVGTLDNLQPLVRNLSGLPLSMSEMEVLKRDFQALMRATNPAMQDPNKSATATAREASITGGSLQEIARHVEDQALRTILEMQLAYNQQYLTEESAVRITQDDQLLWRRVSPQSVRHKWDIRIVGSQNMLLREQRLMNLLQFVQLTGGNELLSMMVNWPYMLRKVYRDLTGEEDADEAFLNSEELAAIAEQQMLAMQGGAGGQEGASVPGAVGGGEGSSSGVPAGGNGTPAGMAPQLAAAAPFAQSAENARLDTPTST